MSQILWGVNISIETIYKGNWKVKDIQMTYNYSFFLYDWISNIHELLSGT